MSIIIESYQDIISSYDPSKNTSSKIMSKYELTKIIGSRLEQLARGCPSTVDNKTKQFTNLQEIVNEEIAQRKIPFMIVRTMPNGIKEYWRMEDMIIPKYNDTMVSYREP
jgi:DNA-directed RNA polymerase subunit K/omega